MLMKWGVKEMQRVFRLCRTQRQPEDVLESDYGAPSQVLLPLAHDTACVSPNPQPGERAAQAYDQMVV